MPVVAMPFKGSTEPSDDLRALMREQGLTQRDVSHLACVSVKTVEGWLADRDAASFRTMHVRHLRSIRLALPGYMAAKRGRKA